MNDTAKIQPFKSPCLTARGRRGRRRRRATTSDRERAKARERQFERIVPSYTNKSNQLSWFLPLLSSFSLFLSLTFFSYLFFETSFFMTFLGIFRAGQVLECPIYYFLLPYPYFISSLLRRQNTDFVQTLKRGFKV